MATSKSGESAAVMRITKDAVDVEEGEKSVREEPHHTALEVCYNQ